MRLSWRTELVVGFEPIKLAKRLDLNIMNGGQNVVGFEPMQNGGQNVVGFEPMKLADRAEWDLNIMNGGEGGI